MTYYILDLHRKKSSKRPQIDYKIRLRCDDYFQHGLLELINILYLLPLQYSKNLLLILLNSYSNFHFQGAVSVRFFLHETSFCIVCSHLASGGKDGDEWQRNSDAMEILSRTTFPRGPSLDLPQKILDHEYVNFNIYSYRDQ